jgi:hypothetical protein
VAPHVHLNPGNAGTGTLGRHVEVTLYNFVGMLWNVYVWYRAEELKTNPKAIELITCDPDDPDQHHHP